MSPLVERVQPTEQLHALQQLEQLGAVVSSPDFKQRMRSHLVAEAAAHHTPLIYRNAAGQLVEEWIGYMPWAAELAATSPSSAQPAGYETSAKAASQLA